MRFRLGDEPNPLRSSKVNSISQEFRPDWGVFVIREKFGKSISQSDGHDLFGRGKTRADGTNPRAEGAPSQLRNRCREDLEQSLGDETELNVAVIGRQLASDGLAVGWSFHMEILVSAFSPDRRHGGHPEVIGEGADDAQCLLE